ncbi:MAG: hypothetical protein ACKN9U_18485, partial [Pirellulaceae bacterium]
MADLDRYQQKSQMDRNGSHLCGGTRRPLIFPSRSQLDAVQRSQHLDSQLGKQSQGVMESLLGS